MTRNHLLEISLRKKIRAYSDLNDPEIDSVRDGPRTYAQSDRILANIKKKHGKDAADFAQTKAHDDHFGRVGLWSDPKKVAAERQKIRTDRKKRNSKKLKVQ
jgi:hypothetical protein